MKDKTNKCGIKRTTYLVCRIKDNGDKSQLCDIKEFHIH